MNKPKTL
jgi:hypothetical protein